MPKQKPKIPMRITKGGMVPADRSAVEQLRAKRFKIGEVVFITAHKPRSPGFHRLAHRLGTLVAENIEGFTGLDAHKVIKRLQLESGIGCEVIQIIMPGIGPVDVKQAESIAFQSLDESEFRAIYKGLCDHIAKRYWHGLDAETIRSMTELMEDQ